MTSQQLRAAFAVLAALMLSHGALAIPNYSGSVVAECTNASGGSTNVTATVTGSQWDVLGLYYTFAPASGPSIVKTGASGVSGGNNTVARFAVPPGSYAVTVRNVSDNAIQNPTPYQITATLCGQGSLTVKKTVINTTGKPIPVGGGFSIKVSCGQGFPAKTVVLNNANGYMQTVGAIPVGKTCTIQEVTTQQTPPNCNWVTTYPQGTSVTIAGQMGYFKEVVNRLACKGMPN
jgi:hypothetical protein